MKRGRKGRPQLDCTFGLALSDTVEKRFAYLGTVDRAVAEIALEYAWRPQEPPLWMRALRARQVSQ